MDPDQTAPIGSILFVYEALNILVDNKKKHTLCVVLINVSVCGQDFNVCAAQTTYQFFTKL